MGAPGFENGWELMDSIGARKEPLPAISFSFQTASHANMLYGYNLNTHFKCPLHKPSKSGWTRKRYVARIVVQCIKPLLKCQHPRHPVPEHWFKSSVPCSDTYKSSGQWPKSKSRMESWLLVSVWYSYNPCGHSENEQADGRTLSLHFFMSLLQINM